MHTMHHMSTNEWGRELRTARLAEGHSQQAAAGRLGIDRGHLSKLERGKARPSVDVAARASDVYEVPMRLLKAAPVAAPAEELEAVAS